MELVTFAAIHAHGIRRGGMLGITPRLLEGVLDLANWCERKIIHVIHHSCFPVILVFLSQLTSASFHFKVYQIVDLDMLNVSAIFLIGFLFFLPSA